MVTVVTKQSHCPKISTLKTDSELYAKCKQELLTLIDEYSDNIDSENANNLGLTHLIEHEIDTENHTPVKQRPYQYYILSNRK